MASGISSGATMSADGAAACRADLLRNLLRVLTHHSGIVFSYRKAAPPPWISPARAGMWVTGRWCVPGEDGEDLGGIDARFAVGVVVWLVSLKRA
jgi:hypothetical protein